MTTNVRLKRRAFLQATATVGVFGMLGVSCRPQPPSSAAEEEGAEAVSMETIHAHLDAIAREHVTIPKEEGQFLHLLVKLTRAQQVLELGTGYGYTAIWLAAALAETGGKLTTVEIQSERLELAKQHLAEVGLAHRVRFHQGDAHAIVPTLPGGFDIAYLDADKGGNVDYFNKLFPHKLAPGSLLVAHNAILLADAMRDYLDLVHARPELETVLVRAVADDGFAVSYCRRDGG